MAPLPINRVYHARKSCIAWELSGFAGIGSGCGLSRPSLMGLDGIALFHPGVEATKQWTHVLVSVVEEEPRHPGAGGFIGSGAVHHDGSVGRNLAESGGEFRRGNMDGAGNLQAVGPIGEVGAQINHGDCVTLGQ